MCSQGWTQVDYLNIPGAADFVWGTVYINTKSAVLCVFLDLNMSVTPQLMGIECHLSPTS